MANRGCRDKYINKNAVLTTQLLNDQKIATLDTLRSQLYIALGSPFQLLSDIEEQDGYKLGVYLIWQEDSQAELLGYQNWDIPLDYQLSLYKKVLDKLKRSGYNGNIQLKLDLGNNVIYIEEYKKRKRNKKPKDNVIFFNVVQLKLGLVG